MRRRTLLCGIFLLGVSWMGTSSSEPEYGSRLGIRRGEQASLVSQGISVLSDALYPTRLFFVLRVVEQWLPSRGCLIRALSIRRYTIPQESS